MERRTPENLLADDAGFVHRLARALVRDPDLAHDVAQDALVAALEGRHLPRGDAAPARGTGARATPAKRAWLATVTRNLALRVLRSGRERSEREQCAARPEADEAETRTAERLRVHRELTDALAALPEPYRTAVTLRFFDGLPPRGIARRRGQSVATARQHVHRGLLLLREHLDRRFGNRRDWLSAFAAIGPAAAVSGGVPATLASVLVMKKCAAAVLLILVLGSAWLLLREAPGAAPTDRHAHAPQPASIAGSAADDAASSAMEPALRQPVPTRNGLLAGALEGAAPTPTLTIRGRCITADTGAPLPGCIVTLTPQARRDPELALLGPSTWLPPDSETSGEDGVFTFVVPLPDVVLDVEVAAASYASVRLTVEARGSTDDNGGTGNDGSNDGDRNELGDIEMSRGWPVRGQVVDREGRPFAIEELHIGGQRTATDAQGAFAFAALPAGPVAVHVTSGEADEVPPPVTVPAGGTDALRVVVDPRPFLAGHAFTPSGAPAAGALVQVEGLSGNTLYRVADIGRGMVRPVRVAPDGSFHAYGGRNIPRGRLLVHGAHGFRATRSEETWPMDTRGIRLSIERSRTLELVVTEAGSGAAVEHYCVQHLAARPEGMRSVYCATLGGEHPGGRVTVPDVWAGRVELRVVPRDPVLLPSQWHAFDLPASGEFTARVEVERGGPVRVEVRFEDGTGPVAGTTVELVHSRHGTVPGKQKVVDDPRAARHHGRTTGQPASEWSNAMVLLSSAETDAAGQARLFLPRSREMLYLRVMSDLHLPLVRPLAEVLAGRDHGVVTVQPTGSVRGRVDPPGVRNALRFAVAGMLPHWSPYVVAPIAADGRFELTGMPPGDYRLALGKQPYVNGPVVVQLLRVDGGDRIEIVIDAKAHAPASIRGRFVSPYDGLRPRQVVLVELFEPADLAGRGPNAARHSATIAADSTFHFPFVAPGAYRASLAYESTPGTASWRQHPFADRIVVGPGQKLDAGEFTLPARELRIRLLHAEDRSPLPGLRIHLSTADTWLASLTTDSDGWVSLAPAPAGSILVTGDWDGRPELGKVEVEDDPGDGHRRHETTLRVTERSLPGAAR